MKDGQLLLLLLAGGYMFYIYDKKKKSRVQPQQPTSEQTDPQPPIIPDQDEIDRMIQSAQKHEITYNAVIQYLNQDIDEHADQPELVAYYTEKRHEVEQLRGY